MKRKLVRSFFTMILMCVFCASTVSASSIPEETQAQAVPELCTEEATVETYHYEHVYYTPNMMVVLSPSTVNTKEVVEKAYPIIFANEGGYTTVTANDNGAVSIGRLQWHANRALNLLRAIISESGDVPSARVYLGDALYNEITADATNWISRTLTTDEALKVIAFLENTSVSESVQDKIALSDITSYVNNGIALGIRNVPALIYYADLENQGGAGRSKECAKAAVNAAICDGYNALTLNELYLASISNSVMGKSKYMGRRARVYKACAELGYPYCQDWDRIMPCVFQTSQYVGEAWLQWALNAYGGASLSITDQYDAETKAAVSVFQEATGLEVDGSAGRDTVTMLAKTILASKTYKADAYVPFIKIYGVNSTWEVDAGAESFLLGAKCTDSTIALVYTSSNPEVATVGADGLVDPIASGSTTITISVPGYEVTKSVTIKVTSALPVLSSDTYTISEDMITGLNSVPTEAATFLSNIGVTNGSAKVVDANGAEVTGNIGTGNIVNLYDGTGSLITSYTVVVYGDTNGDGNIWATDYTLIKKQIMSGNEVLTGPYKIAADINRDGNIYATDYAAIKNYIMKGTAINQGSVTQ